jgi:DNA-binding CsgD family transcriptional regulator
MFDGLFEDLIADMEGLTRVEDGSSLLLAATEQYGLKHISYLGLNIRRTNRRTPLYSATYSESWCRHYEHANYLDIDPVIVMGLTGLLPIDWSTFDLSDPKRKRFFGEAREFGVGRQGLTFPVRGRGGEIALFSINSDLPPKEWAAYKKVCMRDFQLLAHYFHASITRLEGGLLPDYEARLSPREKECLQWAANGKTAWETSSILSISEATVRIYLDSARHRLDSATKVQAVAKAIALGIIKV